MANGAAVAAAAAAAIAKAIQASGVLVRVSPEDFKTLVGRAHDALVVTAESRWFDKKYKYLLSYKGFAFFTKSSEPIALPGTVATIEAQKIWIPGA